MKQTDEELAAEFHARLAEFQAEVAEMQVPAEGQLADDLRMITDASARLDAAVEAARMKGRSWAEIRAFMGVTCRRQSQL